MVTGDNGLTGLKPHMDMDRAMDTVRAETDNVTTQHHHVVVNTVLDRVLRPDKDKLILNQVSHMSMLLYSFD